MSRHELRRVSARAARHFDAQRTETHVTAMAVDPCCLYAYWHLDPCHGEALSRHFVSAPELILRIHNLDAPGEPPAHHFDIEAGAERNGRYVSLPACGGYLVVELALRGEGGEWVPAARSATIDIPSAGPAPGYGPAVFICHAAGLSALSAPMPARFIRLSEAGLALHDDAWSARPAGPWSPDGGRR